MGKRINWEKVGELAAKIREQGLSLAEGARAFGIPVRRLYELNRHQKQAAVGNDPEPEAAVEQTEKTDTQPTVMEAGNTAISTDAGCFDLSPLPDEVQRLMGGFASELRKLDEALRTLAAFVARMRRQTANPAVPQRRTLH